MPAPIITKPNQHFDVTTYTGNGATYPSSQSITGLQFQPDFTWIKSRSNAYPNFVFDAVRGAGKELVTNDTAAETNKNQLSAFISNGFSVAVATDGSLGTNGNGSTFVGWNWKAGGTAVTNTSGSISSQVSVNTTAGFSIVTYTGNNTLSTVGHGLGVSPAFIIVKDRSASNPWVTYHQSLGVQYYTLLSATDASYNNLANYWGSSAPTSTTFSINAYGGINTNGDNYVAYCWAPVAGYSAFGKYTGNGSSDGPFVYTGFRPRYVLIKRTDSAEDWIVMDSARNTFNVANSSLFPNGSFSETTDSNRQEDFLSNGFKIRSSGVWLNASGGTFIYMAFAEAPLKFANAR